MGGFKVSDIRSRELDDQDNERYIFQLHYHLLPIIPELVLLMPRKVMKNPFILLHQ